MKLRRKLTAAALILALHAGLLVLLGALSPPATRHSTTQTAPALPSTVVVLLAPLLPESTPQKKSSSKPISPPTSAAAQSSTAPSAAAALAPPLPATDSATAAPLPHAPTAADGKPTPPAPLSIGIQSLQSAAREADKNSVRRLALQSGKIDELETAKAHPIALAAAESSEPRCPPAGQMRESAGPQAYRLTPDRSGDCERDRAARVRARALGR